jgi:hypothetical protein
VTTDSRLLRIRRPGVCCICHASLEVGESARWEPPTRSLTCLRCLDLQRAVVSGEAGGSARAVAARRRAAQAECHDRIKKARPVVGRLALALVRQPDAGRSFAVGAKGEQLVGRLLDRIAADGHLLALHDRRLPRSVANVDHIAVTQTGVWVIDAKRYSGKTTFAVADTTNGPCVVVNGRRNRRLVTSLDRQVHAVAEVLEADGHGEIPIRSALCFVDTELPLRQREVRVGPHLVTWPKRLREHLTQPGDLGPEVQAEVLRAIARRLAPAA